MSEQEKVGDASPPRASRHLDAPVGREPWRVWAFAVYSVFFELIVWGLFGWAVFIRGASGWWMVLAVLLSGAQLKPRHFGIEEAANPSGQLPLTRK